MKFPVCLVAAVAFGAAMLGVSIAPAVAATPVLVKQCFVTPPKPLSKNASGTQIDYVIYGKKKAREITFAVRYRNSANHYVRTVTDEGIFSPGIEIQHHFALFNDVTYGGKTVQACVPVKVRWADATLWVAPSSH